MRVYLGSIGCRLNQSEIETMARRLLAAGHEIVAEADDADRVVINTCAVTAEAARDARKLTRRIHRRNPDARIFLTGCYATIAAGELAALGGVERVVVNADKDSVVEAIDPGLAGAPPVFDREPILREYLFGHTGNTRAFVKVQDGCDNRCTFCVTTVARGEGRSRPPRDVIAEVAALARAGYREAVLTGVHLGSHGHDLGNRAGLRDLVAAVLERTDIARLRLSSLEPWDVAPGFFDLWRDPRLLPHLHLPLQAGCDRTLRRMARNTTCDRFRELAAAARERIRDVNLTTDVIVGFPGETDDDFEESLAYVGELAFGRLHVFSYSQRPGTVAAGLPDQVASDVKRERARRMIDLGRELARRFHESRVGTEVSVLWETSAPTDNGVDDKGVKSWAGYTDNYIRVAAPSDDDLFNRVRRVRLVDADAEGCRGRIAGGARVTARGADSNGGTDGRRRR